MQKNKKKANDPILNKNTDDVSTCVYVDLIQAIAKCLWQYILLRSFCYMITDSNNRQT